MADALLEFNKRMIAALAAGLREAGEDEESHIRKDIGIPVEYAGGRVIRSAPGDAPRRETGTLYRSIKSGVASDADEVLLRVSAGPALSEQGFDYAAELETGHGSVAERPYMDPSKKRMEVGGAWVVAEKLKGLR